MVENNEGLHGPKNTQDSTLDIANALLVNAKKHSDNEAILQQSYWTVKEMVDFYPQTETQRRELEEILAEVIALDSNYSS